VINVGTLSKLRQMVRRDGVSVREAARTLGDIPDDGKQMAGIGRDGPAKVSEARAGSLEAGSVQGVVADLAQGRCLPQQAGATRHQGVVRGDPSASIWRAPQRGVPILQGLGGRGAGWPAQCRVRAAAL